MNQVGKVVRIEGKNAVVEVKRVSACGENCGHCKMGCGELLHQATVENPIQAKVGNIVKIQVDSTSVLKSAFLLYIMPIFVMLVSYGIAFDRTQNAALSVAACAGGLVVSFFALKLLDKRIAPTPKIIRIISEREGIK